MVLCLGMLLTQSGRQPDWVGTSMPREYTRHTKSIARNRVHSLVKRSRKGWCPGCSPESSRSKTTTALTKARTIWSSSSENRVILLLKKLKLHTQSPDEPEFVACRARGLLINACDPVGSSVADPKMICATCIRKGSIFRQAYTTNSSLKHHALINVRSSSLNRNQVISLTKSPVHMQSLDEAELAACKAKACSLAW